MWPIVPATEVKSIGNCRCVPEGSPDGTPVDAASLEVIAKGDRCFNNPGEAEVVGDDKKLEVEGIGFDEEAWEDALEDTPSNELESNLGIADGEIEEEADEELVACAHQPSPPGVDHDRIRMTFRSHDDIGLMTFEEAEVAADLPRRKIAPGIVEEDRVTLGVLKADPKGMAFTQVFGIVDDLNAAIAEAADVIDCPIGRAIGDDDDLKVANHRPECPDKFSKRCLNRPLFVVGGYDD